MRTLIKIGLGVGLAASLAVVGAQALTRPTKTDEAFKTMRTLLSAQAKGQPYNSKNGYGTLREILAITPSVQATMLNEQEASYQGYLIHLTVSEDRKHFSLAVVLPKGQCGTSWFSNEHWVYYAGQPNSCN